MGRASKNSWAMMKGVLAASEDLISTSIVWNPGICTSRDELDVLSPDYLRARYPLAIALLAYRMILHRGVAAKELSLGFSQYRTCLD